MTSRSCWSASTPGRQVARRRRRRRERRPHPAGQARHRHRLRRLGRPPRRRPVAAGLRRHAGVELRPLRLRAWRRHRDPARAGEALRGGAPLAAARDARLPRHHRPRSRLPRPRGADRGERQLVHRRRRLRPPRRLAGRPDRGRKPRWHGHRDAGPARRPRRPRQREPDAGKRLLGGLRGGRPAARQHADARLRRRRAGLRLAGRRPGDRRQRRQPLVPHRRRRAERRRPRHPHPHRRRLPRRDRRDRRPAGGAPSAPQNSEAANYAAASPASPTAVPRSTRCSAPKASAARRPRRPVPGRGSPGADPAGQGLDRRSSGFTKGERG